MAQADDIAAPEPTSRELVFAEIRRLGLEANVLELEENGYTVVPNVLSTAMVERMRDVILHQSMGKERARRPAGPDNLGWRPHCAKAAICSFEDPVFEAVVQNEYTVALMQYLLGRQSGTFHRVLACARPGRCAAAAAYGSVDAATFKPGVSGRGQLCPRGLSARPRRFRRCARQ